jgi:hypothetical protein
MSHEIGEQWIEDGRMYKAVRQIGTQLEKKDLGPVNEDGLIRVPFEVPYGYPLYPTIQ